MKRLFFYAVLLSAIAIPHSVAAAPITQSIGSASAMLTLNPDPPQPGTVHATLVLTKASATALASTTITYSTEMSEMHMAGAGGSAHRENDGHYTFDVPFSMAAVWSIEVHARGGVSGDTTFHVVVSRAPVSQAPPIAMHQHVSMGSDTRDMHRMTMNGSQTGNAPMSPSMNGMAMGSESDTGPWRVAAFILLAIILLGAFISRRVRTPWAYVVLGIAGAAVIIVAVLQVHADAQPGSMNGMDMNAMSDIQGHAPVAVRAVSVTLGGASAHHQVYAPGILAPFLLQDIVARSSGVLENFTAYAGSRVTAGEILAQLNEPELAARAAASAADASAQAHSAVAASEDAILRAPANIIAAKAAVATAKLDAEGAAADVVAKNARRRYWAIELQREQTLLNQGAVSQQEFQDERAQAAAADADATIAQHRLHSTQEQIIATEAKVLDASSTEQIARATAESMHAQAEKAAQAAHADAILAGYTTVVAPMDGIVLKRVVDPGTYVQAGTVIAKITVIDRLRIQANIPGSDLSGIRIGTPISAKTSDGISLHGYVTSIAPVADSLTRLTPVEAVVGNPGHQAIPGGYLHVVLDVPSATTASSIRVPSAAIVTGTQDAAVWRIVDHIVQLVPVQVVSDDGHTAVITGGLRSGDRIVVDGAPDLQPGQRVSEMSP